MAEQPTIIVLSGPTGAGKTRLGILLAKAFSGSIVNIDSRQVYADFPIITAQPTPEEQRAVPHLLYGFLPTTEKMTAGRYATLAAETIATVHNQNKLPILVGGTGLYIKALLDGIAPIPPVPAAIAQHWQEQWEGRGGAALHALLAKHDPAYAVKVHPNDRQRITRALEVMEATGEPLTAWHQREAPPLTRHALHVIMQLPLDELTPRLEARIGAMLSTGALEEATAAKQKCPDPTAPGWSGIGCAELLAHLQGKITLPEARELWLKHTRAYAKRQITWFRGQHPEAITLRPDEDQRLLRLVEAGLIERGAPPHAPQGA